MCPAPCWSACTLKYKLGRGSNNFAASPVKYVVICMITKFKLFIADRTQLGYLSHDIVTPNSL